MLSQKWKDEVQICQDLSLFYHLQCSVLETNCIVLCCFVGFTVIAYLEEGTYPLHLLEQRHGEHAYEEGPIHKCVTVYFHQASIVE